jgi:hypothetical protein
MLVDLHSAYPERQPENMLRTDLLPIAQRYYYHPAQQGSWSLKRVLPVIAPDLRYDKLDRVQDGGAAMMAYLEAVHPQCAVKRKDEIRRPGRGNTASLPS